MNTIQDDLTDLDRLIDGSAAKDETRSLVRLIAREVAALEAEYSAFAQGHAQLKEAHAQLQDEHAKLIALQEKRNTQAWEDTLRKSDDMYKSDYTEPGF